MHVSQRTAARRVDTWRHIATFSLVFLCWLLLVLVILQIISMTSVGPAGEPAIIQILQVGALVLRLAAIVSIVAVALPTWLTGRPSRTRDTLLSVVVLLLVTSLSHPLRVENGPLAIIGDMILTFPFALTVSVASALTVHAIERQRQRMERSTSRGSTALTADTGSGPP